MIITAGQYQVPITPRPSIENSEFLMDRRGLLDLTLLTVSKHG